MKLEFTPNTLIKEVGMHSKNYNNFDLQSDKTTVNSHSGISIRLIDNMGMRIDKPSFRSKSF